MARWLIKSDPEEYAFADLVRHRRTRWDGVGNALALRHLGSMRKGDEVLVYESGRVKAERAFREFELVRISRLSVMPVSDRLWNRVLEMSEA